MSRKNLKKLQFTAFSEHLRNGRFTDFSTGLPVVPIGKPVISIGILFFDFSFLKFEFRPVLLVFAVTSHTGG
jgi:hypothetical protein